MADSTQAIDPKRTRGDLVDMSASNQAFYSGTLLTFNSSGYVINGGDDASTTFAGVAADNVDNSGGSAGDETVPVYTEGIFEFNFSSASQADVGQLATLVDNQTVAVAGDTTNDVVIGVVVALVSSSKVKVKIQVGL